MFSPFLKQTTDPLKMSLDLLLPIRVPAGEAKTLAGAQASCLVSSGGGTWMNSKTQGQ